MTNQFSAGFQSRIGIVHFLMMLGEPPAKQFLLPTHIDAQHQVEGFVDHTLILANFDDETVNIDNG
jgi:hypothetical protein